MNPLSYLKSLFGNITVGVPSPSQVPPPVPPKPSLPETKVEAPMPVPEPSCLIKGIAKAWVENKGWKVSRERVRMEDWWHGVYSIWLVILRNKDSGLTIALKESPSINPKIYLYDFEVTVEGKEVNISQSQDRGCLEQAILSHPYSSLKRRMSETARRESSRAAKIEALEALGCPPSVTSGTSTQSLGDITWTS